jgi:hypothetical protein
MVQLTPSVLSNPPRPIQASNDASLMSQAFDNISGDPHGSFDNRVALVYANLQALCGSPAVATFCVNYKTLVHPHFPGNTPLSLQPHKSR